MVGGDTREHFRASLENKLQLAELAWVPSTDSDGGRAIQSLVARLQQRTVQMMILLLRFCGHPKIATLLDAAKKTKTPFVFVQSGYGESAILQALLPTIPTTTQTS
jgi:hypothetical protein